MKLQENIPLKNFTTLRVGGEARYFVIVKNEAELREALNFSRSRKLPIQVLGGGSNLLISDGGFHGLIIKNEIKGIKFIDQGDDQVILEAGSGEILDEIISLSVIRNLSGLENLSGIPGTVGGAAVQNAGAYGVEIKDRLLSVIGLNIVNGKKFIFPMVDCQYGYRNSLFKKNKKFIITEVVLKLNKKSLSQTAYLDLRNIFGENQEVKGSDIRTAILKIRKEKLPDWHTVGTAGCFFKNIILSQENFDFLRIKFPELPGFPDDKGKVKVSTAWILDKIFQLKGFRENDVALYEKQPLVLVNYGKASAKEIKDFAEKIKKIVKEKIGIEIEEEVEKLSTV